MAPTEQVHQRTVEAALVSLERVQQRTVDVPVPQMLKETLEVVRLVPRERAQQRSDVQIVELPRPQITEDVVQRAARLLRDAAESRRPFELSFHRVHDP